jgi:hypothetical protein
VTFGADAADTLILDYASSFNGMIDDFFVKGDAIANTFAEGARTSLSTQTGADSRSGADSATSGSDSLRNGIAWFVRSAPRKKEIGNY